LVKSGCVSFVGFISIFWWLFFGFGAYKMWILVEFCPTFDLEFDLYAFWAFLFYWTPRMASGHSHFNLPRFNYLHSNLALAKKLPIEKFKE
jgi:hypothetical protein